MPDDRPAARELLANLKRDHDAFTAVLDGVSGEWGYEDVIYRFWHQSWKVYGIQNGTDALVAALRGVSPEGRPLHPWFEDIVAAGTGQRFEMEHKRRWLEVTRPMLEAFWHARFFAEMAAKYAAELDEPQALDNAERRRWEQHCDQDEAAFTSLFGPDKISENLGEFLGYFMIRKVMAGEDLMRAAGTVTKKLAKWLGEHGYLDADDVEIAAERGADAGRNLPKAERLSNLLFDQARKTPVDANALCRRGKRWHILEVGNVYP